MNIILLGLATQGSIRMERYCSASMRAHAPRFSFERMYRDITESYRMDFEEPISSRMVKRLWQGDRTESCR